MTRVELEGEVTTDHKLRIEIPKSVPPGRVKVVVEAAGDEQARALALKKWLLNQKLSGRDRASKEELDAYIDEQRNSWD